MFLRFLQPHWRPLRAMARQYAASPADAEDLVQETLLRAWRNYSPAEERSYSRGWLLTILRHAAIDRSRKASSRIRLVPLTELELTDRGAEEEGPPGALPALSEEAFREWLDDRLAAALDAVQQPYREVLMLSVSADLSYREIAAVLDCPIGTVMSRMARARRQLRRRLSELGGESRSEPGGHTGGVGQKERRR